MMKYILFIWILILAGLTGLGVWATYTGDVIKEASGFDFSLREDTATGRRPLFFQHYYKKRSPRGGGRGRGK